MSRSAAPLVLISSLALAAPALAGESSAAVTHGEIADHVGYLASDALEGRGTGTRGERLAGDYLAERFAAYGLEPGGEDGSFYQPFEVAGQADLVGPPALSIRFGPWAREFEAGVDWSPFGFTASFDGVDVPLVFAGYGVSDPARSYDDYAGIDVRGKAVLLLRHEPREQEQIGPHSVFTTKVANARAHGAVAVLVVTDPVHHPGDRSLIPFSGGDDAGLFAAHVRQDVVEGLFRHKGLDLAEVQAGIDRDLRPRSFDLEATLSGRVAVERTAVVARNVIARLPGADPALADEVVVIGAHYDHLGDGSHGGSLGSGPGEIHNGADDNASGTAGLLELAQALAAARPRRSVLFIGFSGEERGLLGSAHYVANPTVAPASIVAMLNLDMIGRLRDGGLEVGGVDTSPGFRELVSAACAAEGLEVSLSGSGLGPSDHASFYAGAEVPVLFFFTGLHADYHRPSDDVERLDAAGAARVTRVALACAQALADAGERPAFVKAPRPERRARLGIFPDRQRTEPGVGVADAVSGGPAAEGGIVAGDVIAAVGDEQVEDLRDLVAALGKHEPGDVVDVRVVRGAETLTLSVRLGGGR